MKKKPKSATPSESGFELTRILTEAEGGCYALDEAAKFLGIACDVLRGHVESGHLVSWIDEQDEIRLPRWQFDARGGMLTGIHPILDVFSSRDQWRVMRYFLGKRVSLDNKRPLDLLRSSEVGRVLSHARTHFEDNTW
jgi:hypothetical protein